MRRLFEIRPVRTLAVVFVGFGLLTFAGFAVLIAALGLPSVTWFVPPAVVVTMAVVFFGLVVPVTRPCLAEIDQMRAGQAWAHWSYTSEEWVTLGRLEDRRIRRYMSIAGVVPLVGCVVLLFTPAYLAGIVVLAVAALVVVVGLSARRLAGQRSDAGEVYLSPRGIYLVPGGFQPLFGFGGSLLDVTLDELPGPPVLRFTTAQRVTRWSRTPEDAAVVPVPAGQLGAARQFVARLATEVFKRPAAAAEGPVRRLPSHLFDE